MLDRADFMCEGGNSMRDLDHEQRRCAAREHRAAHDRLSFGVTMRGLSGRRVILTGGASGIGRAAALRLAEEGCVLGIFDLDEVRRAGDCRHSAKTRRPIASTSPTADQIVTAVEGFEATFGPVAGIGECRGMGHADSLPGYRPRAVGQGGADQSVRTAEHAPRRRARYGGAWLRARGERGVGRGAGRFVGRGGVCGVQGRTSSRSPRRWRANWRGKG